MENPMSDVRQRLIQKFGTAILDNLKTADITAEGYKSTDLDIQQWLLMTRPDDVERALNADRLDAASKKLSERIELSEFYIKVRAGEISPAEVETWLETNFADDWSAFRRDFPQAAVDEIPANAVYLFNDVCIRRAFPTYGELVKSFSRLALPEKGYPTITLLCPDGNYRSGYELAQAIKVYPLELLNAKPQARPAYETMSASEFLKNSPELQDNRQPALLKKRFDAEFQRFLGSDVGRAWRTRMDAYDHTEKNSERLYDFMIEHSLTFNQKNFEIAAIAVADEISVTLYHEDIGGVRASGLEIHDGGGSHHTQHSLGATMAGQIKPDAAEDTHTYSEAETRRLVRKLSSDEYRQLLNDSPRFRAAVDKHLG